MEVQVRKDELRNDEDFDQAEGCAYKTFGQAIESGLIEASSNQTQTGMQALMEQAKWF